MVLRSEEARVVEDEQSIPGLRNADPVMESALRELRPGIDDRFRRNMLFGATGIATALSVAFWIIGASKDVDSVERIVVPALTLCFGVLTLLAWRGRLRSAELGLLAVAAGVLLERIHFTRHSLEPGLLPVLDTYELLIWFPSVYVFAFLLIDKKYALLYCVGLLAGSLFIVWDWMLPGTDGIYHADLTEFYIGQMGAIMLVFLFAQIKERFLDTHKLAVDLRSFAEMDFLTGIFNRRAVTQILEQEMARADRLGGPLSVVLIDLDHFKRINDSFGHDEGDRALRRVALLVDRSRRQTDGFGRWGGEEFLLVVPGLGLEDAARAADRLRGAIEAGNRGARAGVTASFGVAEYRDGDKVASLVKRADQALMDAKARGRNRVVARAA